MTVTNQASRSTHFLLAILSGLGFVSRMNNKQLNTVAAIIENNGIKATQQSTLAAAILAGVQGGADLKTAFDHVIGAGCFDKLVGDLYDSLRAGR